MLPPLLDGAQCSIPVYSPPEFCACHSCLRAEASGFTQRCAQSGKPVAHSEARALKLLEVSNADEVGEFASEGRVERALAGGKRDSCDYMEFTEQA
jgi:hypothetical protein